MLNGSQVTWKSELQNSVTLSTFETEWTSSILSGIWHRLFSQRHYRENWNFGRSDAIVL